MLIATSCYIISAICATAVYRSECSDGMADWLISIAICRSRNEAETVEQNEMEWTADVPSLNEHNIRATSNE